MFYLVCQKNNVIYGPKGSVVLTEKEMTLFLLLVKNKKNINDIINQIWMDRADVVNQNTLSQLAFRLRNKLQKASIPLDFTLSLSKGVKKKKLSLCAFISIRSRVITGVLNRVSEAL